MTGSNIHDAALEYAARGLAILPIARGKKKPHPILGETGGFHHATTDRDVIDQWFAEDPLINAIGARPGPGFCVVDLDSKNDGLRAIRDLEARIGDLPPTRTTLTPSGGEHRWYRLPPGVTVKTQNPALNTPGVDVISRTGYVLMPPSTHPNGGTYELDAGGDHVATFPQSWIEALAAEEIKVAEKAPERIAEGSRNATLASLAGSLRRPGFSEAEMRAALRVANAERCVPPLPESEVDAIARSVARYEAQDPAKPKPLPPIEHASIVATEPPEPIEYDVETIAPSTDAPALMFGPPASLKSWIALGICDAIVRGVPFAGLTTRKRPYALYLNLDAGARTFRNRVRAVSSAPGLDFASFSTSEYSHDVLRALLAEYRGGFVVIDCLSSIYNPDTRKDPAFAMRGFVDDLRALYAEHDCGGIVIDHPHRPKERGELGDYHGSIQKEAAFRTMWAIQAEAPADDSSSRRTKITCRKLSEGAPFSPIDVEIEFGATVTMRRANAVDVTTRESIVRTKILEWAIRQTTTFSKRTVDEKIRGHRAADIRAAFDSLIESGEIEATGKKRGNGETYRHRESASASGTHSDAPDALKSVAQPEGASARPLSIGDAPSGTHSGTHPETTP